MSRCAVVSFIRLYSMPAFRSMGRVQHLPYLTAVLLVILGIPGRALNAQGVTPGGFRVGVGAGVLLDGHSDRQVSPLRYSGTQIPVRLDYTYTGRRFRHGLALSVAPSRYTSSITSGDLHEEIGVVGVLDAFYTRNVLTLSNRRINVLAGAGIQGLYHYTYHQYTATIDEYVGVAAVSLGPILQVAYTISPRAQVSGRVHAPLLAFVVRPPYSIKGDMDERVTSISDFMGVDTEVTYSRNLTGRLYLDAGYTFRFNRAGFPESYRTVGHHVFSGVSLWF